jgi:hypothetical protein
MLPFTLKELLLPECRPFHFHFLSVVTMGNISVPSKFISLRPPRLTLTSFHYARNMKVSYTTFFFTILSVALSSAIPAQHVHRLQSRAVDVKAEWTKAWCKGSKFAQAMIKNEDAAAAYVTPVRSAWDGELVQQFRTWGYREIENHRSELCDFGKDQHILQRAFAELGIGTASSVDSGPNHCFHVEHKYGPTVQRPPSGQWPEPSQQYYMVGDKKYRV